MAVELEEVVCKAETDKAILVEIEGDDYWIPQSQVTDDSEVWKKGDEGMLAITDWWAKKEGLDL